MREDAFYQKRAIQKIQEFNGTHSKPNPSATVCPEAADQTFTETKGKYLMKSSTELDNLKKSKSLTGLLCISWS